MMELVLYPMEFWLSKNNNNTMCVHYKIVLLSGLLISFILPSFAIACSCTPQNSKTIAIAEQSNRAFVIAQENGTILWKWEAASSSIPASKQIWFHNPSEVKPVYNGKYLLVTASGGAVALIRIADKKVMFYAYAGENPHSAELLPDGNIVTASSTDQQISIFRTDTVLGTGQAINSYKVSAAHNVVWDRMKSLLYTTDNNCLVSYEYNFNQDTPALFNRKEIYRLTGNGSEGSHDLFPVYGESALFWTTNSKVYKYDLITGQCNVCYCLKEIKSISSGPDNTSTMMLQPTESWWSDRLIDSSGKVIFQKPNYKMYKARWMVDNTFSYPPVHQISNNSKRSYSNLSNTLNKKSGIIEKINGESVHLLRDGVTIFDIDCQSNGDRTHMFVAQVDLNQVTWVASTPNDRPELANPDAILSVHAQAAENNGKTVWLGVNGDYWARTTSVPGGLVPMSIFYKEGFAIQTSYYNQHTEVIYKTKDGNVGIGIVDDILPRLFEMQDVIGGRGLLIRDGIKQIVNDQVSLAEERHPRTGVGIANHGKTLYLIVVDGRQPGYSAGASLNDLATIFQALNCSDAIALDGGGSSTMIIREDTPDESASFPLLNKPSDSTGARKISNGILIIENKP